VIVQKIHIFVPPKWPAKCFHVEGNWAKDRWKQKSCVASSFRNKKLISHGRVIYSEPHM
jgi:hypothetical protein